MELQTAPATENQLDRLRNLADRLDYLLETDLMLLAKATASTVEAWRKRGTGPAYVLIGNRYLYPREAVMQFLAERARSNSRIAAREAL